MCPLHFARVMSRGRAVWRPWLSRILWILLKAEMLTENGESWFWLKAK